MIWDDNYYSGYQENQAIAYLSGNEKVDALFNGHTHQGYTTTINGRPVIQAASYAYMLGHLKLNLDSTGVVSSSMELISKDPLFNKADTTNAAILKAYKDEIDPLYSTAIINTPNYLSRNDMSDWLSKLMVKYTNASIGFQNYGGTRVSIDANTNITLYDLYKVIPFDNGVKTCYLTGLEIKEFLSTNNGYCAVYQNVSSFNDSTLYLVVTNDYVFDYPDNPFTSGEQNYLFELSLRDLFKEELLLQAQSYPSFYLSNPLLTPTQSTFNPHLIRNNRYEILFRPAYL
jgi:2',3'-cyclic-nucleotide 2'-phosphodiesterase (5'-nucleotidase family)